MLAFVWTILVFCLWNVQAAGREAPRVRIKNGILSGIYDTSKSGRQFAGFLGIPYARPPTGKYRFMEPLSPDSWTGIFNAAFEGSDCVQYDHINYRSKLAVHGDEDCLYLNVFTPRIPEEGNRTGLMDVIVFIHGGAFMFSAGHYFGPHLLLNNDVVYVSLNYRLGPLGFLTTDDDLIPGNLGLKDQVLALKWVRNNIAAFGGNPESVTIAGMSAGGSSVHYHMLSPLSKGLFKSVIAMSGSALCPWSQTENAREKTYLIARELGCPINDSQAMVNCMRARPARQIVQLSKIFMPWLYTPFSPFGPVVEKPGPRAFIDRPPLEIIKNGVVSDVPLLISFTWHEGLYPGAEIICSREDFEALNKQWLNLAPHLLDYNYTVHPQHLNEVSKEIWLKYVGEKNEAGIEEVIQMIGDRLFIIDILKTAKFQAASAKSPVYLYNFTYRGEKSLSDAFCDTGENYGVSHGDDLSYVVSTFYIRNNDMDEDKRMQKYMVDLWSSFAAKGKPKFGSVEEEWPPVQNFLPHIAYLNINSTKSSQVELIKDMQQIEFWNTLGLNENIISNLIPEKTEL